MNIEKVKNYNQKILAVLGTTVILFAIVGLIAASYFTISEICRNAEYNHDGEGILSDEIVQKLQKENLRQQVVSYDIPLLIDSINMIYAIPVSHKSLDEPEPIRELLNAYNPSETKSDDSYFKDSYGSFNNLLIFNSKTGTVEKLFDSRINFKEIDIKCYKDDIIIDLLASNKDTYADGIINLLDFKSLYLYPLKEGKLRKIEVDNEDICYYSFINKSKNLIILTGIDKDKNGKFEAYKEPTRIKFYNYMTGELKDIVDNEITTELQKTLEGTKE